MDTFVNEEVNAVMIKQWRMYTLNEKLIDTVEQATTATTNENKNNNELAETIVQPKFHEIEVEDLFIFGITMRIQVHTQIHIMPIEKRQAYEILVRYASTAS